MARALLLSFAIAAASGCGTDNSHLALPNYVKSVELTSGSSAMQPLRLQVLGDTLFVAFKGMARLDMYTLDLEWVGFVDLSRPEPVQPSAFIVSDSQIVVCDHSKGAVVVYDRHGGFIDSFGLLPDEQTRLMPLAIARHENVAYISDMGIKQVLAVSLVETADLVGRGELILRVPRGRAKEFVLPSAVFVTPDGRLLVGDAGEGNIRVFTCDGQAVYDFAPVPGLEKIAPQGFALDNIRDPSLQRADSFDPSGVRELGRIHVADGNHGVVHMFNPLGEYLASYPEEERLSGISDITIARGERRVFISDPVAKRILLFSYEGN